MHKALSLSFSENLLTNFEKEYAQLERAYSFSSFYSGLKDNPHFKAIANYKLFEPNYVDIIRIIINRIRAHGGCHLLFQLLKTIVRLEDQPSMPKKIWGYMNKMGDVWTKWGDKKYPPSSGDLQYAARQAYQQSLEYLLNAEYPDPRMNYTQSFIASSKNGAKEFSKRAKALLIKSKTIGNKKNDPKVRATIV